jgi:carbon monoxide dehydrogenase subunit G
MPGAELLQVVDPQTYKGKVSVRLGPVALAFVGTAKFEEIDEAAHRARVKAQGTDQKGRGGANAVVTFSLEPVPSGTRVNVVTNLNLSGSVAQYGRGTGMIQDVATQLIGQFANSLQAMLVQEKSTAGAAATPAGTTAGERSRQAAPAAATPISGFSLMLRVLWNAVLRLFSGGARSQ